MKKSLVVLTVLIVFGLLIASIQPAFAGGITELKRVQATCYGTGVDGAFLVKNPERNQKVAVWIQYQETTKLKEAKWANIHNNDTLHLNRYDSVYSLPLLDGRVPPWLYGRDGYKIRVAVKIGDQTKFSKWFKPCGVLWQNPQGKWVWYNYWQNWKNWWPNAKWPWPYIVK